MTDCYIKAEILSGILDRRLFSDTARVSVKTDNGTKCIFYVNESGIKTEQQIKAEAIKEFGELLCEGRVSNDPVVIAVKAEWNMMFGRGKEKNDE